MHVLFFMADVRTDGMTLLFALLFALAGFMRIRGMSHFDYLKKKKKVVNSAILTRWPSYVVDQDTET